MSLEKDRIVIKYGSDSVVGSEGVNQERLAFYAEQIGELSVNHNIIVVTSGAVSLGQQRYEAITGNRTDRQRSLSTIGQGSLYQAWEGALEMYGLVAAQVLLTHRDVEEARVDRHSNRLLDTLNDNMRLGAVSVINEDDARSDEELMAYETGGDNDGLAAIVSDLVMARYLCLMTGVDGVYDRTGVTIRELNEGNIDDVLVQTLIAAQSSRGRGGMFSKVVNAWAAGHVGVRSYIANSNQRVEDVLKGETGTRINVHS